MIKVREMDGEMAIIVTRGNAMTAYPLPPGATDEMVDGLLADRIRALRDELLAGCDWTQVGDCAMGAEAQQTWRMYRQVLRDIPEQIGFPNAVRWPTTPEH